jgi:beta-lactamase regulating signal transducer with metallopeptidase domain
MIQVLIGIAVKSLLIAGLTLGLLELMKKRSAAERSWVAHIGLFALLIMAFAPLVLPSWHIEAPSLLGHTAESAPALQQTPDVGTIVSPRSIVPAAQAVTKTALASPTLSPAAVATALYAVPATILLFITLLALARLIALRARAEVLVDGHWLSALARAQRRMGFKHGTALLTSDDLASPISWGLMRPVILLNSRAVKASGEAEAIIAHELAHVARMDWIKLLLARIATALFWFNPVVWVLAREAHQLREEAADDSVLAADIVDTDYAQLLVGVARHECPGLLLGAHGVAPSKKSLARRVARVLDSTSVRGPTARPFALGVFVGALLVAAPLAGLTLTPGGPKLAKPSPSPAAKTTLHGTYDADARDVPADLPHIIAKGVSTSVTTAVAAIAQAKADETSAEVAAEQANVAREAALEQASAARENALKQASIARDAALQQASVAREAALERAAVERDAGGHDRVGRYRDREEGMRALGVTPEYIAAIRSAAPELVSVDPYRFVAMKAVGVSPDYIRDLNNAGVAHSTLEQIVQARAIGLDGAYARSAVAAGARPMLTDLTELRTVGITPEQIARARKAGAVTSGQIVRSVFGVKPPNPPRPPRTGRPAASPPDWKTPSG